MSHFNKLLDLAEVFFLFEPIFPFSELPRGRLTLLYFRTEIVYHDICKGLVRLNDLQKHFILMKSRHEVVQQFKTFYVYYIH